MPGRDAALRPAREKTLRFIYYIQHELGFSHLGIADDEFGTADGLAYLPYHREGRRLDGVIRLTLDDVADRYGRRRHFTVPAFRSATIPSTTTMIAVLRSGRYPSRPCRRFRCRWG